MKRDNLYHWLYSQRACQPALDWVLGFPKDTSVCAILSHCDNVFWLRWLAHTLSDCGHHAAARASLLHRHEAVDSMLAANSRPILTDPGYIAAKEAARKKFSSSLISILETIV